MSQHMCNTHWIFAFIPSLLPVRFQLSGLAPSSDTDASKRAGPLTVVGASGTVVFGTRTRPKTVLVCRIPHPTASRPGELIEVVFALNIRLQ